MSREERRAAKRAERIGKAFTALEIPVQDWDRATEQLVTVQKRLTVFARPDGVLVSGEDGQGFVDYYGEAHGGRPYIHPAITQLAAKLGGYMEWENPGAIVFVER
jgi:hypothetical protein